MGTTSVTGPVTGGKFGWPFHASTQKVSDFGYEEQEYFLEGTAQRYRFVDGTDASMDGHWQAEVAGSASFKTRMLVYRPLDPKRFNGTVIVTWNNVTAGHDLFGSDSLEIFEGGYALVCVTTQKVGVDGLPPTHQGLTGWDPERYKGLSIASDDYSFDIFSQAAKAVGPNREGPVDPLGGLKVRHLVAQGASQSAGRLATYINAIAPHTRIFDGYILSIYFGRGSALEVGDQVVNINAPADNRSPAENLLRGTNLLRDDLGVKIFVVNSELESMACYNMRQDDSATFRYWESAGTCHVSRQGRGLRQLILDRDKVKSAKAQDGINAIPMNPLYDAVYYHMHRWLSEDVAPPKQPYVEFSGNPPEIVRDEHGIATGGIRLPQAQVPLAQNSAIPLSADIFALLGGSSHPFPNEKVKAIYGSRETFLNRFKVAALAAVEAGVLRPREVDNLLKEAAESCPID